VAQPAGILPGEARSRPQCVGFLGLQAASGQGTFFQLLDFSGMAPPGDVAFAERLLTEAGVATIPLSPFYVTPASLSVVRLCIAKQDGTLDEAAQRINHFSRRL